MSLSFFKFLLPHCRDQQSKEIGVATERRLSPQEYVDLYKQHPETIQTARVEPPRLGHPGLGRVVVTLRTYSHR